MMCQLEVAKVKKSFHDVSVRVLPRLRRAFMMCQLEVAKVKKSFHDQVPCFNISDMVLN